MERQQKIRERMHVVPRSAGAPLSSKKPQYCSEWARPAASTSAPCSSTRSSHRSRRIARISSPAFTRQRPLLMMAPEGSPFHDSIVAVRRFFGFGAGGGELRGLSEPFLGCLFAAATRRKRRSRPGRYYAGKGRMRPIRRARRQTGASTQQGGRVHRKRREERGPTRERRERESPLFLGSPARHSTRKAGDRARPAAMQSWRPSSEERGARRGRGRKERATENRLAFLSLSPLSLFREREESKHPFCCSLPRSSLQKRDAFAPRPSDWGRAYSPEACADWPMLWPRRGRRGRARARGGEAFFVVDRSATASPLSPLARA
jgi:hypothetical protein